MRAFIFLALGALLAPGCATGMVKIPGGEFQMGSPDPSSPTNEMPSHPVEVSAFYLGIHEVTNGEFQEFLHDSGYEPADPTDFVKYWGEGGCPPELVDHPVVYVNYFDAEAYLKWAGRRLPAEAEWEKAATWDAETKTKRRFPWGDEPDARGARLEAVSTAPVGSHPRGNSPEGVSDLFGNVWEWTSSWFQPYPENMDQNPDYGEKLRVTRGASYHTREIEFTCTTRNPQPPDVRSPLIGFRSAD
ncbi:MAG: SUMF1/EgtB/PvdO family nonheme iron enzyme [Planctomycetota bacterium]|nr:SUMF1/EgtB/PvdO family nonheme iron enzyme [Planctomycetota bacterium]